MCKQKGWTSSLSLPNRCNETSRSNREQAEFVHTCTVLRGRPISLMLRVIKHSILVPSSCLMASFKVLINV